MDKGYLVSLEGVHGAGKTSVGRALEHSLRAKGRSVTYCADQWSSGLGRQLRTLLLYEDVLVDDLAETLLAAAARRQSFIEVIRPALEAGDVVLAERFTNSLHAFGRARGVDGALVDALALALSGGVHPDVTLLFDLPAEVGLSRIPPAARHRVEREELSFHQRLREAFLMRAAGAADRVVVVNAELELVQVIETARAIIEKRLG